MVVAFSSLERILGEGWTIHSLLAFFPPFFLIVEISSYTLIPLFRPGAVHSGPASWDDRGQVFSDELHVSSFPDRFPHYAWTAAQSAHADIIGSWDIYAVLRGYTACKFNVAKMASQQSNFYNVICNHIINRKVPCLGFLFPQSLILGCCLLASLSWNLDIHPMLGEMVAQQVQQFSPDVYMLSHL